MLTHVFKDDPRYFDLSCWPEPEPGQNWAQARMEQVRAVEALRLSTDVGTIPYQIRSPDTGRFEAPASDDVKAILERASNLRQAFPELVPARPYCTDDPATGTVIRRKELALEKRYLQLDPPKLVRWLTFDIDRADAHTATEDANLPAPNFIAVNPANGHSLTAYLIGVPVRKFDGARRGPIEFMSAIERGYRRRLGADPCYVGLLAKNPLHPAWRVDWQAVRPYDLGDLADALDKRDMRPDARRSESYGLSRNCDVFNDTRKWAYANVLDCKRAGGSLASFEARVMQIAAQHNMVFNRPLPAGELRSIAKSIAKWTWARFSEERFSALQSFRVRKRWEGHTAESTTEPWKTEGISRRTWYRRKAAARGCRDRGAGERQ